MPHVLVSGNPDRLDDVTPAFERRDWDVTSVVVLEHLTDLDYAEWRLAIMSIASGEA